MNLLIISGILAIPLGIFLGIKISNRRLKIEEEKLISKSEDVINGKVKNSYNYDGQEYPVEKFKIRDEEDNEKDTQFKSFSK